MSDVKTEHARALRVATRCNSVSEFLSAFGRFVDDSSVFIVTSKPLAVGTRKAFAIQLESGETMMRGDGEVVESCADGSGPEGHSGMRLKLLAVDRRTRALHDQLLARAEAGSRSGSTWRPPGPPERPAPVEVPPPAPLPMRGPSAPILGERAPGASFTLPANPLGELTAEALESFVECTLYEERHSLVRVSDADLIALAAVEPAPQHVPAPPAPIPAPPPIGPTAAMSGPSPTHVEALVALVPGAGPNATTVRPARARVAFTRTMLFAGLAGGVVALAGVAAVWMSRSAAEPEAAPSVIEPPASGSESAGGTAPIASASATAEPASSTPAHEDGAADLRCRANVRSQPPGAEVRWAGRVVGRTPLADAPVPCGPASVEVVLDRYVNGEKNVVARLGAPVPLFLRLERPPGLLTITAEPEDAIVAVDGRRVGKAPVTVAVRAYTEVTVAALAGGFKPSARKIVVDPPDTSVRVELERLPAHGSR